MSAKDNISALVIWWLFKKAFWCMRSEVTIAQYFVKQQGSGIWIRSLSLPNLLTMICQKIHSFNGIQLYIVNLRTCEVNPVGENRSFIFTVYVKSVSLYHFKLAYIMLHMAVKEFFETHF